MIMSLRPISEVGGFAFCICVCNLKFFLICSFIFVYLPNLWETSEEILGERV
jgi:hypothetical protein